MESISGVPIGRGTPISLAKSPKEQAAMIQRLPQYYGLQNNQQLCEAKTLQDGGQLNRQRDIKRRRLGYHFGSKTCIQSRFYERGSQQMDMLPILREELHSERHVFRFNDSAKRIDSLDGKGIGYTKNLNKSCSVLGRLSPTIYMHLEAIEVDSKSLMDSGRKQNDRGSSIKIQRWIGLISERRCLQSNLQNVRIIDKIIVDKPQVLLITPNQETLPQKATLEKLAKRKMELPLATDCCNIVPQFSAAKADIPPGNLIAWLIY
ncbi:MAG: hypothetical protein EZS28_031084 [Streblomastix strix]|uniref:Uncharacterized protein n=1 Tax=Streblomastix strix TaxID=222440 RepID=A0A5J4USK2_9EUKA|nr:MAG: hypothetical protein EZS28_031084 [Streblomastix strix]